MNLSMMIKRLEIWEREPRTDS